MITSESPQKRTIVICETQPVTAEGVLKLLEGHDDLQCVGHCETLAVAAALAQELKPDIVLVDKAYGTQAILDWIGRLKEIRSTAAVVVWGTALTEAEALRFLQMGARGITRKTVASDKLLACFRSVGAGVTWMEDSLFREAPRADRYPRSELTPREQQVLQLVEQGLKNKEIGRELGIRPGTVKIHLKHIFEKTGVRGRYGLALSGLKDKAATTLLTI